MKKRIGLIILLLLAFMTVPVYAKSQNGFYAEENLTLKKEIGTTTFAAGNSVDISSDIDGAAFIAGNTVNISSTQDYLFLGGNSITVNNADVKDAFIAGNQIKIIDSKIRDLYVAGSTVSIQSDIDRNAYLGGDTVTISSKISGNVKVACDKLVIEDGAAITGTLIYPEEAELDISKTAEIGKKKTYKSANIEVDKKAVVAAGFASFFMSLCSILLIAILLMLIAQKFFAKLEEQDKTSDSVLKKFGIGFGTLCLVPIASIFLFITSIGFPLGIILLLIYGIFIYLSIIPTSYFVGKWILKDKIKNDYLILMISLVVLFILKKIPFIGGIVGFVSLCIGLGFFVTLIIDDLKKPKEEQTKVKSK